MEAEQKQQCHFILVHGACHGAWCWYKVKPQLEAAGHRVKGLDLGASGINRKEINEIETLHDYSQPLLEMMASLPPNEKVILVGHSLGGLNLAVAMDEFPQKVSVAVFLAAFMPDTTHHLGYVLDLHFRKQPKEAWLDTEFSEYGSADKPLTSICFGPECLSHKLYQLSPVEDLELAFALARPCSMVTQDLPKLSNEGYGSVAQIYITCDEDKAISKEFQEWMIDNNGRVKQAMNIKGADHMSMFSKPHQLSALLLEIAHKYS